ncbi:tRNA (adenine58-N1)-methyltransferase non-catalytic subunit [Marchantia polymorpha subsp. ruderalis]|uniref:tRNA (adenine(58)-N(1))-methyltransferase non-catalytic subunit TRM6 n=2 Tax=Marchantia polymorpha TaxID=3197 RepID=A0AAF6B0D1_MARPO|nr:hypothetical protein MARPO_0050s0121 [Marchantia polymorpha]BBN05465.1 hypothetical protein Mp_3g13290 [Marchantia polymorpha subsp. ruderalis]|eukprot:PTQ38677.1 hypothetical protein MARPO_0050s0121 [Marchantia polymorpha]
MSMTNKSSIQSCAEFGSSVLLDINDGDRMTFARLHSTSTLKIGNTKCTLEALVGQPFGAVFEMQSERNSSKLVRMPNVSDVNGRNEKRQQIETDQDSEDVKDRDNRALVDDNKAQTLSSDDIDRMKRDGASGKEIIDALVANSASFETKTAFSQEKYMKKKQKKYAPRVLLRRPSARSICEAYFVKDPRKIGFCRMDTLALMMSLANVGPNSDILVLESLGGLITAAVTERLGGHGSICSTYYTTKRPPIDMVRLLNLDDATALSVLRAPLEKLVAARQSALRSKDQNGVGVAEREALAQALSTLEEPKNSTIGQNATDAVVNDSPSMAVEALSTETPVTESMDVDKETTNIISPAQNTTDGVVEDSQIKDMEAPSTEMSVKQNMDLDQKTSHSLPAEDREEDACELGDKEANPTAVGEGKASKGPRPGNEATSADIFKWANQGFSSLLVAAPELDAWTVVKQLIPLLSSSSPFVIYSPYQQPLAECMFQLQKNNMAIALQLTEPWCREYQVLPLRSHPHMQMSATGGFTLSGIRITNCV